MNSLNKILLPSLIFLLFFGCSKNEDIDPKVNLIPNENEVLISGKLEPPSGINPDEVKIVTLSGSFDLEGDATFEVLTNKLEKQVIFLENKNGDILLASLLKSNTLELSATSTSRVMIGLMPWTAYVSNADLERLLDEIESKDEFIELVNSVQTSLNNNTPIKSSKMLSMSYFLPCKLTSVWIISFNRVFLTNNSQLIL